MLMNITYGLLTMTVCLLLEVSLVLLALRHYQHSETLINKPKPLLQVYVITSVMLILVIGTIVQVGIWAVLFMLLGEFTDYSFAFYHSATNFSTLGYGDTVMSDKHRLLGPLEAINGVLMIGITTAALMSIFQDVVKRTVLKDKANKTE